MLGSGSGVKSPRSNARMAQAETRARIDLSYLGEGILCAIASRVAPFRGSIEAMRQVCRHWRSSVPPTRGPWVVLSHRNANQPTVFLAIVGGVLIHQIPLFLPPMEACCWSCYPGLMALSLPAPAAGYSMCVNCNRRDAIAQIPQHLHLTNVAVTEP